MKPGPLFVRVTEDFEPLVFVNQTVIVFDSTTFTTGAGLQTTGGTVTTTLGGGGQIQENLVWKRGER